MDDSLMQHADRLQTLNEISRVVAGTLDLHTLYETIYQQVARLMDTGTFFIALHQPSRETLELPYVRDAGKLRPPEEVEFEASVTTAAIQRGTPLLFHSDAEYRQFAQENGLPELVIGEDGTEAMIFVPLNTGSRTIGALSVQSSRSHSYTKDDVQTLSVIAAQAAVAIENARLFQRSQDTVRQMEALLEVAQIINASLDLQTVLDSILTSMREVVPYFFAAVLLPDYSRGHLDVTATVGPLTEEQRKAFKIPFGEGITGSAFRRGEPLLVPDVRQFPGYIDHGILEIRTEMAIPLKRGETVIGVLDVEREELDGFGPDELNLLSLFASQAAIAIENARLYSEQQQRVDELAAIQSMVQQLTPLHDLPQIVQLVADALSQLIDCHSCRIFLLDPASQTLVAQVGSASDPPGLRVEVGENSITGSIAARGESALIANTLEDERGSQIAGTPRRAESMVGAPVLWEGRVHGVITLSKLGSNQFDQNALRLLEIVAGQAAIAVDRARLYAELRADAVTDELTGLYNRRYLVERYREEQSRATRTGQTLGAIMLDIDRFKRVNDRYGHDAGDVVLAELAGVVRKVVRAEDIVARYGGEEFCILLPEIEQGAAEQVAERLRSLIERRRLPSAAGVRHITVSVGLAFLQPNDDGVELFTRADHAMYEVKRRGGNEVCVYRGAEPWISTAREKAQLLISSSSLTTSIMPGRGV